MDQSTNERDLRLFLTTFGEPSSELTQISLLIISLLTPQLNFLRWMFSIPAPQTQTQQQQQQQQQGSINGFARPYASNPYYGPCLILPGPGQVTASSTSTPQPSFYYQATVAKVASSQPPTSTPQVHCREVSPPPLPVHRPHMARPTPLTLERQHITAAEGIISTLQNLTLNRPSAASGFGDILPSC